MYVSCKYLYQNVLYHILESFVADTLVEGLCNIVCKQKMVSGLLGKFFMKRISKVSVASNNSNNPPECILEQTARIQKRVKNPQHCNIE